MREKVSPTEALRTSAPLLKSKYMWQKNRSATSWTRVMQDVSNVLLEVQAVAKSARVKLMLIPRFFARRAALNSTRIGQSNGATRVCWSDARDLPDGLADRLLHRQPHVAYVRDEVKAAQKLVRNGLCLARCGICRHEPTLGRAGHLGQPEPEVSVALPAQDVLRAHDRGQSERLLGH